jgi:predicted Ser/Thr protein kinase
MVAYRNVRTGEVHEPEPGSWMAERLAELVEVWEPVESVEDVAPLRPARGARKAEWVEFAIAHGYTREDAEALSRDDLARLLDDVEA